MIRAFLLAVLRLYKRWISPLLPTACRFVPTCSEYAADCLTGLPLHQALPRIARRLLRCHPWGGSGYDPALPAGARAAEDRR